MNCTVSGRFSVSLAGLVSLLVLGLFGTPPASAELNKMSSSEMSGVTGREGLTVDLNLNADLGTARFTDPDGFTNDGSYSYSPGGNGGRFLLHQVSINDGGGLANLKGATLDIDDNEGVVVGAPNNTFDVGVTDVCVESSGTNDFDCDDGTGADPAMGSFNAVGTTLENSEFRFNGKGDGLTADVDFNVTVNDLNWTDRLGNATMSFQNVQIGDRGTANGTKNIPGLEFDADATDGFVTQFTSSFGVDLTAGDVVPPNGSSVGSVWMDNADLNGTVLNIQGNDKNTAGGFKFGGDFYLQADALRWDDADGVGSGGGIQLGSGSNGIELHNGSNGPVSFSGFTFDVESDDWIVIDPPSSPDWDLDIDEIQLGNSNPGIGLNVNAFKWGYGGSNETLLQLKGNTSEGVAEIQSDLALELNIDSIDLVDNDGLGGGDNGTVRFGIGSNIDFGTAGSQSTPAEFSGLSLSLDSTKGAVLQLPNGSFLVDIDGIAVGEPGNFGNSMGSINIDNADFGSNSEVAFRGTNEGLELGVLLDGVTTDFKILDGDGWDGGTGTGGEIFAKNATITVDDGGGNPATISMDADGSRGMVTQAQDATVDFTTDTVFLGNDQGGSPSPVSGNIRTDGTTIGVFSR